MLMQKDEFRRSELDVKSAEIAQLSGGQNHLVIIITAEATEDPDVDALNLVVRSNGLTGARVLEALEEMTKEFRDKVRRGVEKDHGFINLAQAMN